MVKFGIANTRMKDFHDLHNLSNTFEFDGKTLTGAVRRIFKRRGTELPREPTKSRAWATPEQSVGRPDCPQRQLYEFGEVEADVLRFLQRR